MTPTHSMILNFVFIALGVIFQMLESILPERKINLKTGFSKDILAFFLLSLCGVFLSTPLIHLYRELDLSFLAIIHSQNSVSKIILATLLTDFFNYWIHFHMHKQNWFWKTHIHHHRIEELYWFSGLRASLGHYASFIFSRITVGIVLFNLNSFELLIYLSIGLITNFYQHTNAKLSHPYIEWILVTPRIHRLHHASNGKRLKNIATIFSFWDRLFGTYENPESVAPGYSLGVKSESKSAWKEIVGF